MKLDDFLLYGIIAISFAIVAMAIWANDAPMAAMFAWSAARGFAIKERLAR